MRGAYPAFAAAGMDVVGIVGDTDRLSTVVGSGSNSIVVMEAGLYKRLEEAVEAVRSLAPLGVVVILPKAWEREDERFKALPNLVAGFTKPVSWPEVAASVRGRLSDGGREIGAVRMTDEKQKPVRGVHTRPEASRGSSVAARSAQLTSKQRGLQRRSQRCVRLGFYGARGGVGTSSAALLAAQVLADADYRVAVFDATGRGDLHVMMGYRPDRTSLVVRSGRVKLCLRRPDEDAVRGFDAVVIDGGREQGAFNADWVEVTRPLDEGQIRGLTGVAFVEGIGSQGRRLPLDVGLGALNLGGVISVEVTE
jgi:hypothetical protein